MTQTHIHTPAPSIAWSQALQLKLMAALDAAWAILERSHDPAEIRKVRDRAKAIGDLAAMARKVALIVPTARKPPVDVLAAGLAAAQGGADLGGMAAPWPSLWPPRPNMPGAPWTSSRAADAGGCEPAGRRTLQFN